MKQETDLHIREQLVAEVIGQLNAERLTSMQFELEAQDSAFDWALREMKHVRDFVGSPENILGRADTKHGEIAEQVEVGIRRARDALNQRDFSANINDVPRTGPVDYQIGGVDVQSKFYNGLENSIRKGVDQHLDNYAWFREGGRFYHIPADQHAQMEIILKGATPNGFSDRTANRIREHLQDLADRTGRPIDDLIRPSISDYADVQQGKVHETLNGHEDRLYEGQAEKTTDIRSEHQPSLNEAAAGAALAAVLAAGLNLTVSLYRKHKSGVTILNLSKEDWKELGIDSAKAGGGGFVSAAAIYGLTNCADMAAPLAGALASATRGIWCQAQLYKKGELTRAALIENSFVVSGEAGLVAISAAVGQTLIPIPVLGAVLGSVVGKFVAGVLTSYLNEKESFFARDIEAKVGAAVHKLDAKYQELVGSIVRECEALEQLIAHAFSCDANLGVAVSIEIAIRLGVPGERIITTRQELDQYMMD